MTALRSELAETSLAVGPVAVCAAALLLATAAPSAGELSVFVVGVLMTITGFALFLEGVRMALVPAGEQLAARVAGTGSIAVVLAFAAFLGAIVTFAEPDVRVLATQLERADALLASRMSYIVAVSLGVGISMGVAMIRAVLDVPLIPLMLAGYVLVAALALVAPAEALAQAFDFGAVTTGPVSVPLLLALNSGVVAVLGAHGNVARSFGLIGIGSIGPIIAVLLLAILGA